MDVRFPSADEDETLVNKIRGELGAVVGGANKSQTIEDGEEPYSGNLKVPVFEMTMRRMWCHCYWVTAFRHSADLKSALSWSE